MCKLPADSPGTTKSLLCRGLKVVLNIYIYRLRFVIVCSLEAMALYIDEILNAEERPKHQNMAHRWVTLVLVPTVLFMIRSYPRQD